VFQASNQKEKAIGDSEAWEESYWSLLHLIFSGFYLESSPGGDNNYIDEFFQVEIKVDVVLLRMVLDIVNNCLKQVEPYPEALDNSTFLNES